MNKQEKQRELVEALGDYIAKYVEENSPITLAFRPYSLTIDVCGTKNLAMLKVSRDAARSDPMQLRLQLGGARKGTDRLYSNFMPAADAQETIRILRDPASHEQWLEQIKSLSDSVDDYWD